MKAHTALSLQICVFKQLVSAPKLVYKPSKQKARAQALLTKKGNMAYNLSTIVITEPHDVPRASLMGLPCELRLQILEYLLP